MDERVIVPGSWPLGGARSPWPTARSAGLDVGNALTLLPTPRGPRSLRSGDGSLGGLALPPTLAVSGGVLWLLDGRHAALHRFDPLTDAFVTVAGWGASASGAAHFGRNTSIAGTCGFLALTDLDTDRVVVTGTAPLLVRSVLRVPQARPVAVAGHGGVFHVLDDRGRLWRTTPAQDRLVRDVDPGRLPEGHWGRLLVDATGRPWRVDVDANSLLSSAEGEWEWLVDADAVRPRCPVPPLVVDRLGRFRVPAALRLTDTAPGAPERWFDVHGDAVTVPPDEYAGPAPYVLSGRWTGGPVDSGTLGCRWHRISVTGVVPAGCAVTLETATSDEPFPVAALPDLPDDAWSAPHRIESCSETGETSSTLEHAVLSGRGRHLAIRISLLGDGWGTPRVEKLLVEPQRKGLERFLPVVYSGDDEDAEFLRRFLAVFGTELDRVEHSLRNLPARFSPKAVTDEFIDVLAAELGVPLERGWSAPQRRAMLKAAPRLHRRRGTPAALTAMLRTHLEAASGRSLPQHPVLVEGFRERDTTALGQTRMPMAAGQRTWSDDVVGRPVLGARRADTIRLVSVGERLTDRFRVHAHRFTVVVPGPLLVNHEELERFERLVSAEKPAHVAHEVVLVEPRAIVGRQALLGVDTFVGVWPEARLAPSGCRGSSLGLGLRLGRGPVPPPRVGHAHIGVATVVV